ncbi:MAG: ABC transporter permease [Victivallales bacterium]|nr:ABC transporter permease [Victivallales bacterium]
MNRICNILAALLLFSALELSAQQKSPAPHNTPLQQLEALLRRAESRVPGSEANLATEKLVAEIFKSSGHQTGEITFNAPCFQPGKTTVTINGRRLEIKPMHPGLFRPGNFTQKQFKAQIVDAGHGTEQDLEALNGIELDGAIALMDFACSNEWMRLLRFGVRGFIFIEDDKALNKEAEEKLVATEVRVPRFFIGASEGAELRSIIAGKSVEADVEAEPSRWQNKKLHDLWVMVPGTPPAGSEAMGDEIVLITAPMDANSIVPELAQGAQNGANLLLLVKLFEAFNAKPPARTTIFCAVNAHTQYYLGERQLTWNMIIPRSIVEKSLDTINGDLRMEEMLLGHYSNLKLNPPTKEDGDFIISLRDLVDSTTGKNCTVKEPIVDLARREVNLLKGELLHLSRSGLSQQEQEERRRELEDLRHHYVNVLTLFNKVGVRTNLEDLDKHPLLKADGTPAPCSHPKDFELQILKSYVDSIVSTRSAWARLNRQEMAEAITNNSVRDVIGGKQIRFALALELDWSNDMVGLATGDSQGSMRWQHKFGLNAAAQAAQLPHADAHGKVVFVDTMTRQGGMPEGHFFPQSSETTTIFHAAYRLPAFAIRNPFTKHGTKFTTADTFRNLDDARINSLGAFASDFIRALVDDPKNTRPSELRPASLPGKLWTYAWGAQVKAFRFDDFSASVMPQLPVPGSVIVIQDPMDYNLPLRSGDVTTGYIAMTDERASITFPSFFGSRLQTNAFKYDDDFIDVQAVIDAGEAETKISSQLNKGMLTKTLALFNCVEYPIYTRDNPAMIGVIAITEDSFLILNGRLNSAPKKFGLTGCSSTYTTKLFNRMPGPAAIYLEKNEPLKLLTNERVLAIRADSKNPLGYGFTRPEEIGADFFATATADMSELNTDRMAKLAGTSDELAAVFRDRGDTAIKEANEARQKRNWTAYLQKLHLALGAHLKAYKRMTAVTNDMLKAVVFYLALMLPFCFFAEKLLFKFKKIEQEMLAFCVMFAVTFCVFRVIHPAFKVAQAPEAIFIAFVMGGLGAFVIKILHDRFEGEMQLLFKTSSVFETGQAGFSTAGQSAMLIGVNNMKRRRIRTALTTATVVLVTFTMLAFTSISKKMSPTVVSRSSKAPYTGLMYHWPGNNRMDEATLRTFEEILAGRAQTAVRRWLLPVKNNNGEVPFRLNASNGKEANIDACLGISVLEHGFIGDLPLSDGSLFTSDTAREVLLPEALATALGYDEGRWKGQSILLFGTEYKIVGVLNDLAFQSFKDINQRPIIPIKSLVQQTGGDDLAQMAAAADEDASDDGVFYADLSALVVLPVNACKAIGGQPYSISAKIAPGVELWSIVDELLTITNASKFYISSTEPFQIGETASRSTSPGVYYIGEGYRTSIGGLAFLLIPLLISSTIILNTMLGSVFERKAEIAIYNAVGLNPTHIGMFFLAEAFVYSVIGSVGGYLIGQGTSIFLTRTKLITNINLNFSSLSVVYVIMFTVAVVLLSTIYPSIVATRAAVPSGKRKWSLPENDGKVMNVVFPFIYQHNLIFGIIGYLDDYFARFTEASFGDLIAQCQETNISKDSMQRDALSITYQVALAPFDLGVTQELKFSVAYDDKVQAYRLIMLNTRISGQDSNWCATNMPFLEKLRTYLMHWRNLSPAEHEDYARKGNALLGHAPDAHEART